MDKDTTELDALKQIVKTFIGKVSEINQKVALLDDWIEKITSLDDFKSALPDKLEVKKKSIGLNPEARAYDKSVEQMEALRDLEDLGVLDEEGSALIPLTKEEPYGNKDLEFDINDII